MSGKKSDKVRPWPLGKSGQFVTDEEHADELADWLEEQAHRAPLHTPFTPATVRRTP